MTSLRTKTITPIICTCGCSSWVLALDGPTVVAQCIRCNTSWAGLLKLNSVVSCMGQPQGRVGLDGIEFTDRSDVN